MALTPDCNLGGRGGLRQGEPEFHCGLDLVENRQLNHAKTVGDLDDRDAPNALCIKGASIETPHLVWYLKSCSAQTRGARDIRHDGPFMIQVIDAQDQTWSSFLDHPQINHPQFPSGGCLHDPSSRSYREKISDEAWIICWYSLSQAESCVTSAG
jgi:hypothetical protein